MKLGSTGTQEGMTYPQRDKVITFLSLIDELHHGDCVGSDEQMHTMARGLGNIWIVVHPPLNSTKRAFCIGDVIKPEKPYIPRNHDIVDATDFIVASPKGYVEELRGSGTWATIRYAKKIGKPLIIIFPDGTTETFNMEGSPK